METLELLDRLVAFDTVSDRPNVGLIGFVQGLLEEAGAAVEVLYAEGGAKANLYATVGPSGRGGVLLSGHTDVVPVTGQDWTVPPFVATRRDARVYGRGTADMKGFVACAVAAALVAARRAEALRTPLHLALSHDEEIGCIGVHSLIELLAAAPFRPALCIVGEPTGLAVAIGHKGKLACRARCTGRAAHSALAPTGLNAIHLAADLIGELRALQHRLAADGAVDPDYDVPYSTVHVGRIGGGVALNIVPDACTLEFEIRNVAADDPAALLAEIETAAERLVDAVRGRVPEAAIDIERTFAYPGLDTPREAEAVAFVRSLTGANHTLKVAFGTEGGLFAERLDIPTVVCGPGSMAQGHKPDEFVEIEQLTRCDAMLAALLERLEAGL